MKPGTRPITIHETIGGADPLEIVSGPPIVPTERMKLFSPSDWEGFVNEWASSLGAYGLVERTSGAGDLGCDVIGTVDTADPASPWDNFQCKHYTGALAPTDIWIELGKLCYYTSRKDYSVPRKYYFVAPRGVGGKLIRLLKKPADLKAGLLAAWDDKCASHITKTGVVALDGALLAHIDTIDFGMFGYIPPLQLVEQHLKTRFFAVRFGLGLPPRPSTPAPPTVPGAVETRYVEQLFAAYSDNLKRTVSQQAQLSGRIAGHFSRAREAFYCAEALRNFSRDTLPDGAFDHLQDQIYEGVVDVCDAPHTCGFTRVVATTVQAANLQITSSALLGRFETQDRHGICHQLANADRLTWVPSDD
jgi:hypothetical protein